MFINFPRKFAKNQKKAILKEITFIFLCGMKKALLILSLCILSFPVWALQAPQTENYILNDNSQQVLSTQGINDPIRDGAYKIINSDPNTPGGSGSLVGII